MFLGLDSTVHPDGLIGLWDSAPFDFGATEATKLALLPDGRGWSELANAAGARDVRRLTWEVPRPGVIELRYVRAIDANTGKQVPDYEFVRTQYAAGETALRLAEPVDFARQFGLAKRGVAVTDDPSHELVPYGDADA
jgi:hypothetical protein